MEMYTYFEQLWLNKKETQIFFTLYKLWLQPASVIANSLGFERTYVYKVLIRLVKLGFVVESLKWWTKNFFASDLKQIQKHIQKESEKIQILEKEFENIEKVFEKEKKHSLWIPKIHIFEWFSGLENMYQDMFDFIETKWYISIKLFASNTNGISLMENLSKVNNIDNLYELPAWNSAINMYLIGKSLYIITFKEKPIWIKMENEELWSALHFIFEHLN